MRKFKSPRAVIASLSFAAGVLVALCIIPSADLALTGQAASSAGEGLSGSWVCKSKCPAGGEGKIGRIQQNGITLTFTNEGGQTSGGSYTAVGATDWRITATIENGGEKLVWSNGTVWEKQ